MKKSGLTEAEKAYKRFEIFSSFALYGLFVFSAIFGVFYLLAKTEEGEALFGCSSSVGLLSLILISPIVSKRRAYYQSLIQVERNAIVRNGLFKEVYDAYKYDGFEFNLAYDKLLFQKYHNNIIDIAFVRSGHKFLITIDEKSLSIIVDEHADSPIITEFPLTNISTLNQLYQTTNEYTQKFC